MSIKEGLFQQQVFILRIFVNLYQMKEKNIAHYLQVPETKIAEFANSIDLDEVAHNELPHSDLHCLSLVFELSI